MRSSSGSWRLRPPPRRGGGPRPGGRRVTTLLFGLVLAGCRSTLDPATGDPRLDLQHADPRVRIRAAEQAVRESRMDLCALLVENLRDRDGAVRLFCSIALRKLTGKDFGYKPYGAPIERQEAIDEWRKWLESEGLLARDASESDQPVAAPPAATAPADEPRPDAAGEDEPEAGAGDTPAPPSPAVPLDSADGGPHGQSEGHPAGGQALREKKLAGKADDRWGGTSSEAR